jgi:hypothetical protein
MVGTRTRLPPQLAHSPIPRRHCIRWCWQSGLGSAILVQPGREQQLETIFLPSVRLDAESYHVYPVMVYSGDMATDQEPIKFWIPREDAAEFRRLVAIEDRTMTAVIRRLIREYIAASKQIAA